MSSYAFLATSALHLESLLAEELQALGCTDAVETRGGSGFSGPLVLAYRACLWSRVASRVLLTLVRFPAPTPEALYEGVRTIRWTEHLRGGATLAVDCKLTQSAMTHAHYAALKVKDAIVDQLRADTGTRPSVDIECPDLLVHVRILRDTAVVSIDLSGESLHRRGYRTRGVAAPLKENLAAAILLRAQWPRIAGTGGELCDPMCGSGTLVIEAASIAADIAPGLARTRWGFLGWSQHDRATWSELLDEARARRDTGLARALPPLRAYDHDAAAVRSALSNVERAGLGSIVHIERRELEQCAPVHAGSHGLLVANPPYGERIGASEGVPELYTRLGRLLRERFIGWQAAILTGDAALGRRLGLRATRIHTLYNGRLECKLLHFDVDPARFGGDLPRPVAAEARSVSATMFANRLRKNQKHLARWLEREGIHCYRLYDADLPEYAVAVDVYEGAQRWIQVQEYAAPKSIDPQAARSRLREALGVILEVLDVDQSQLFLKVRQQQKGRSQYGKLGTAGVLREVAENGCRLLVNLEDYLDTGLFLDQRLTRRLIGELAREQDFLNLFGYTGSATVHAARGGARSTTTVDLSRTYLDWARRNLELNGFRGPRHVLIQADCLRWLDEVRDRYGLIYLDPPAFSTSKRMRETLDVQRDHVQLIEKAARLLVPGGALIFSTNLRTFRLERDALPQLVFEDLSRATLPRDFERNPRLHHCWRIRRANESPRSGDRSGSDRA
jgi:23S rRNA (guanine2445-N2)-methyltransferase / 23S rRNA (guanine2069-N7)-methyltransferase